MLLLKLAFMPERVPKSHDHMEVIEFVFYSGYIFWILHQPSGGSFGTKTPLGISGSLKKNLSHFMTLMLYHLPVEAGKSLCVICEACIHASEGAQVLHDHVGIIEFIFYYECIFWVCTNYQSWWRRSWH